MSNISTVMPDGGLTSPSVWKKPRRTFEEIIKELAKKPIIYNELSLIPESTSSGAAKFCSDGQDAIFIHRDGRAIINGSTSADLLAAISTACTEIAANHKAAIAANKEL